MTIREVEGQTGLARSIIRFYEKEKLIHPSRNESNGYRDYAGEDVEALKKIAYLRTLGFSIEDIRSIISGDMPLPEAIRKQSETLEGEIAALHRAKLLCENMLCTENLTYETLRVEQFVDGLQEHWKENRSVFRLDSVGFVYLWGRYAVWAAVTAVCLFIALLSRAKLPSEIPVQWSRDGAVSFVGKNFIFAYPLACVGIRYLLRPCIYARLKIRSCYSEYMMEYLTNCMCFITLTVEVFSILYLHGMVKDIRLILAADVTVLTGLLLWGMAKINAPVSAP